MAERPNPSNGYHHEHTEILLSSFRHWTGRDLITTSSDIISNARTLFTSTTIVVSHGTEDDPIFNYGNASALELFELEWDDFTRMPSRKSADAVNRTQRANILNEVAKNGFSESYAGIRISASGRRFQIADAILWNLLDNEGRYCGQAACFDQWEYL